MPRTKSEPISNFALGGVLAVALITVAVLGGLFYKLHARNAATQEAGAREVSFVVLPSGGNALQQNKPNASSGNSAAAADDAPVIRAVTRSGEKATTQTETEIPLLAAASEVRPTVAAAFETPARNADNASLERKTSGAKDNNELIPDITGPSYTTKKAMSNTAESKPMTRRPDVKKPEPKKPAPPPKPPAKIEPSSPPALPPLDPKKVDISKAPVYVLNDGRRIRALAVRENGATITVKNEAGAEITFKKSDVKQILRG